MFYKIVKPIIWVIFKCLFFFRVKGAKNVPQEGRCIIASNHMSLPDPIFIGLSLRRQVFFMAKAELFSHKVAAAFFHALGAFPVHRGANDLGAIRTSLGILKQEKAMGIFPQGHRERGEALTPYKSGFALLAVHAKSVVVPTYVQTKNQRLRPFRRVTVIFGKPMTCEELGYTNGNSENLQQMAQNLYEATRRLAGLE